MDHSPEAIHTILSDIEVLPSETWVVVLRALLSQYPAINRSPELMKNEKVKSTMGTLWLNK